MTRPEKGFLNEQVALHTLFNLLHALSFVCLTEDTQAHVVSYLVPSFFLQVLKPLCRTFQNGATQVHIRKVHPFVCEPLFCHTILHFNSLL